jgi:hypothetical protein
MIGEWNNGTGRRANPASLVCFWCLAKSSNGNICTYFTGTSIMIAGQLLLLINH